MSRPVPPDDASSAPRIRAIDDFPTRPRLLARGLTRRCAWCADRTAYFNGWFKRQARCRACGHGYRRGDVAFELGALTANIILTFLAVLSTVLIGIVATLPGVNYVLVVVASSVVGLVGPAVFYPIAYTLWQAIDLCMRPPTPGELRGDGDATL